MYEKLRQSILPELILPNAKILVAISGGPDSVALAHILWRYAGEAGNFSLILSHVNHGVRLESEDEARLVRDLAARWNIPCLVHRFDAKGYAKEVGRSFQEAAREWRYNRWQLDMRDQGCNLLATAHHLGDQAETILYRLLRGSGTSGLAGIYPAKDGIIRPLLTVTKEEILAYCAQEGLPYALDRSNEEPVYDRNRIRLQLLPELSRDYNPQILQALGRTGELLRWDEEYLTAQANDAWNRYVLVSSAHEAGLSPAVFREPAAILSRLLRKAAAEVTQEPRGLGFKYIKKIIESHNNLDWSQNLPGLRVVVKESGIWFIRGEPVPENDSKDLAFKVVLQKEKWTAVEALGIFIGFFSYSPEAISGSRQRQPEEIALLDAGKIARISEPIVCRNRHEGDRIWLRGIGHKSLKKIFQEARIPAGQRNKIPVIAAGEQIIWIPGLKLNSYYLPEQTDHKVCFLLKNQL